MHTIITAVTLPAENSQSRHSPKSRPFLITSNHGPKFRVILISLAEGIEIPLSKVITIVSAKNK